MRIYLLCILSAVIALTLAILSPSLANVKAEYLTDFQYGVHDSKTRNFTLIVEENQSIPITSPNSTEPVMFSAWTFNGTVPGPTLRMTEGDHVFITVINSKNSTHNHSFHMHSIHPPSQDGTFGPSGTIRPGESFTYEFMAWPAGLYPYHCHVEPIQTHINRGLYGAMIIDPKIARAPANEMVMMMNSYDLDLEGSEEPPFRIPSTIEANQIMGLNTTTTMKAITPVDGMTMNVRAETPHNHADTDEIKNNNGDSSSDDNDDGGDSAGGNSNDNNDGSNDSGNSNGNDNDGGSSGSDSGSSGNSDSGSDNGSGGSTTSNSGSENEEQAIDDGNTTAPTPAVTEDDGEIVEEKDAGRPELEQERDNEFYTVNGRAFQYMDNPIQIKVGEPQRIYLLSMTEFDPVNNFHLHSAMFNYTASGTKDTPAITTDIVTLGQGDRGIIEFTPKYAGKMMFHAHINEFTQLGWMGTFEAS